MKKLYKKIPKFANVPNLEHHSGGMCYCEAGSLMGELWQVIAKSKTPGSCGTTTTFWPGFFFLRILRYFTLLP